jgi:hypothetical protein
MLILKYISHGGISSDRAKVFLDNEYLCRLKAGEIKEFPTLKGKHYISTHIIKKTDIFRYKLRVHIKDEEDRITVEIRNIEIWLRMLTVISILLFGRFFPEIKFWILCLLSIIYVYSLHWICQPLSFKKSK